MTSRVGVLGGSGACGVSAASVLHTMGYSLRIGGRSIEVLRGVAERELNSQAEAAAVDVYDDALLEKFCADCDVIVNCAGPSYRIGDRVAQAAFAAGASYVDVAGDDPLRDRLTRDAAAGVPETVTAVVSAGVQPGVSGILPRWLAAEHLDTVSHALIYAGGLEHVTPAAAGDYLISLGDGHGDALAAWRGGRIEYRALQPLSNTELPHFPTSVTAYPHLAAETVRLARDLGADSLDWYNVSAGEQLLLWMNRLRDRNWLQADEAELAEGVAQLEQAGAVDLAGRTPYYLQAVQLDGLVGGRSDTLSAVFRTRDSYRVSGSVAGLSADAVLRGEVPPGCHFAEEVLEPGQALQALRKFGAVTSLEVLNAPLHADAEEGTV
ncbi:saccharopine dehydrogenase NADP-binding domain-containing protein [Streptomyces oceani]|uniref:Saccharopine dehydrogenase NADP binding domain-containing protein n=1 Tax=Streptomyces oceani TaxID=1075402 RepID=A0A1E7KPI5_9ACTN|nr:saccharopine dehydrogenase NADP-binding domain-containing protein [Streptomyces oceani]OEV05741.1 hypothetical protein AN216_01935 [Streptomyces oceani]